MLFKRSASLIPASVLILGIVSFALLIGTNWIRERLVATDMARLNTLTEFQLHISTVHLWLEEYVTGDNIDLDEISSGLERAARLCRLLIEGGAVTEFDVQLPPIEDGPGRDAAIMVRRNLDAFSKLSGVRLAGFEQGEEVGIGSNFDAQYDGLFQSLVYGARAMEEMTRSQLIDSTRLARILYRTILVSWLIIIVFAVTALWTREKRRRKAEDALHRKEQQLLRSQKMEAVGRLAGGITHDINNYLAAITTNCELVKLQTESNSPVAKKMDAVLGVAKKISTLIEQLLAFSRQHPMRVEVVNLNTVIDGMGEMLSRLMGEDIRLIKNLKSELWSTHIDPSQAEQILINLVVNARQAMPAGGEITLETDNIVVDETYLIEHASVEAGDFVMLAVSDNGPGVPKFIQDKIFEPFYTTKDSATNSGLGLSTIYGIVQQNHGHIWLYSEPDLGARFKIFLPRVVDGKVTERKVKAHTTQAPPGTEHILLVEDNDEFRHSLQTLLVQLGYLVTARSTGEDAWAAFTDDQNAFELMITDVVMPGISGRDLVEKIRAEGSTVPVIFMSGYTADVMQNHGLIDEHINLLQKPFSADVLGNKIREVFRTAARSETSV